MSGIKAQKYTRPKKARKRKDVVDAAPYLHAEVVILWEGTDKRYLLSRDHLILMRGMGYLGTAAQVMENTVLCRIIFNDPRASGELLFGMFHMLLADLNIKEKYQDWNLYSQQYVEEPQTPPEPVA